MGSAIRTAQHCIGVPSSCITQVPQRVVCTGYSNGGAYAELCGIWAAIQWPAAPVRVITWGAPVVRDSRHAHVWLTQRYCVP
jgi:Lipase (class 3)